MQVGRIRKRELDKLAAAEPVTRQSRRVAGAIRDTAADLAPVDEGDLRRSLTVEEVTLPDGSVEFHVGWDPGIADYGFHVETGTSDTLPQPHLRPAANKIKGR